MEKPKLWLRLLNLFLFFSTAIIFYFLNVPKGLITNSECILCGKCIEVCEQNAITFKFVWNRENYKNNTPDVLTMIGERNKIKKDLIK